MRLLLFHVIVLSIKDRDGKWDSFKGSWVEVGARDGKGSRGGGVEWQNTTGDRGNIIMGDYKDIEK